MTTSTFAAGAYASIQGLGTGGASALLRKPQGMATSQDTGVNFAQMVSKAIDSTAASGAKADQQIGAVAAGRADVVDVVTAVAESEAAIETLVAVRDRVIAAYEEIMRMPI
jgi:flagellar hook-basal body complex protein FliE